MITFNIDGTKNMNRGTQEFTISVNYGTTSAPNTPQIRYDTAITNWIFITNTTVITSTTREYTISVAYNSGNSRFGSILFTVGNQKKIFYINQFNSISPIYIDSLYTLPDSTTGTDYKYHITDYDNNIIYEGKSVALDSASSPLPLNIPRIVDYNMHQSQHNYDLLVDWYNEHAGASFNFYKGISEDQTSTRKNVFFYLNDWSYKSGTYYNDTILNKPVNSNYPRNNEFTISVVNLYNSDYSIKAYDSTNTLLETISLGHPLDIVSTINVEFDDIDITARADVYRENTLVLSYKLVNPNCPYIEYKNSYGGIDKFVFEGNVKENDTYNREQYTSEFVDVYNPIGKITKAVNITRTFTAVTGYLTDSESKLFFDNVLPSTSVFLAIDSEFLQVNITNSSVENYKFKNNRKLNQYTLTLEYSQNNKSM